jgi:hypothetical protein
MLSHDPSSISQLTLPLTPFQHRDKFGRRISNIFWVNLHDIDLSAETGKLKKLDSHIYSGNATADFKEHRSFTFLGRQQQATYTSALVRETIPDESE